MLAAPAHKAWELPSGHVLLIAGPRSLDPGPEDEETLDALARYFYTHPEVGKLR